MVMKVKDLKLDPISLFSHELKTPLCVLKLNLDLLERNLHKKEDEELIQDMKKVLNDMIDFISHQLDLKMLDSKKNFLDSQWLSLNLIIEQTLKSLQAIAKKKHLRFVLSFNTEDYEVFADSVWLCKVLENLLSNAIKFSKPNSKIIVDYHIQKQNLRCSVKNTILKNSTESISADASHHFFKNSGLGLKIIDMIIKAHEGEFYSLIDKKNATATHTIVLPQFRKLKKSA